MYGQNALGSALTSAAVAVLACAAWQDVRTRTIPNRMSAAVLMAGLGTRYLHHDLAGSAIVLFLLSALSVAAWSVGLIGGADVKLIATASTVFAPVEVPGYCLMVALAGGGLSIAWIAYRAAAALAARGQAPELGRHVSLAEAPPDMAKGQAGLPYAVAILAGTLLQLMART